MIRKSFLLPANGRNVRIEGYLHENGDSRDAVLICPGGGYAEICDDREGAPIAEAYYKENLCAFILYYHVGKNCFFPMQLEDAVAAMQFLRKEHTALGINKDGIFAVGFSAGGHLAGSLLLMPEGKDTGCAGAVLGYPVVSANTKTHRPSFENLTGIPFHSMSAEEKTKLSLPSYVNGNSKKMFIFHTAEDTVVPPDGSLALAKAYCDHGVSVALHLYPHGNHGIALATEETACGNPDWIQPQAERWLKDSVQWMKSVRNSHCTP